MVKAGVPFSFNYRTFDFQTGLFVRAKIYDSTSGTPTFLANVVMVDAGNGCYVGTYTGVAGKTYTIDKIVYTDGTYATIDTTRAPSTTDEQCVTMLSTYPNSEFVMTIDTEELIP